MKGIYLSMNWKQDNDQDCKYTNISLLVRQPQTYQLIYFQRKSTNKQI